MNIQLITVRCLVWLLTEWLPYSGASLDHPASSKGCLGDDPKRCLDHLGPTQGYPPRSFQLGAVDSSGELVTALCNIASH